MQSLYLSWSENYPDILIDGITVFLSVLQTLQVWQWCKQKSINAKKTKQNKNK